MRKPLPGFVAALAATGVVLLGTGAALAIKCRPRIEQHQVDALKPGMTIEDVKRALRRPPTRVVPPAYGRSFHYWRWDDRRVIEVAADSDSQVIEVNAMAPSSPTTLQHLGAWVLSHCGSSIRP